MINIPDQRAIIDHYGKNDQTRIAMEELGELIQAINKAYRADGYGQAKINLVEEIADVMIMLEQMKIIYQISDGDIQWFVDNKCKRQLERMGK